MNRKWRNVKTNRPNILLPYFKSFIFWLEICQLPATSPGQNCRAYLPRWTYDAEERKCVQFIYSGCGATANMYLRKFDCQQKCGNYEPNVTEVKRRPTTPGVPPALDSVPPVSIKSRICELPLDAGSCFGNRRRYYFNKDSNRCLSFTFKGCGGNDNNFQTGYECLRTCGGSTPAESKPQRRNPKGLFYCGRLWLCDRLWSFTDVACTHVNCPMNLYTHYTAMSCEPIYDGNSCCPTRFDCGRKGGTNQSLRIDGPQEPKCQYKGKYYSIGQEVGEASSTSGCRAACSCADFGGNPRINCASIECPETFGARPPGKENCTLLYRKGECCAHDYHCVAGKRKFLNCLILIGFLLWCD